MSSFTFSRSPFRIVLSSDNLHLISPVRNALLNAGFLADLAHDYLHLEKLWMQSRHDVVLFEVSNPDSVELATGSALRIKRHDPQQFVAYLADANLRMSGLTGDAIFSRDASKLPEALRLALPERV